MSLMADCSAARCTAQQVSAERPRRCDGFLDRTRREQARVAQADRFNAGQDALKSLSARTGLSEQELMGYLSQILPDVVDKLTPNGRLPTRQEASRLL